MSQHIIGLQAANIKRLSAVKIVLDKDNRVVILSGSNAQGKSSVLDCILMALCGKEAIPGQPIRAGQESGEIVLETEQLTVKRTFTLGGGGCLTVTTRDGFSAKSPQTLLETMIERVGFDPLAFSKMDHKAQAAKLLQIFPTPIDLNDNAAKHELAYAQRSDANREVKRIEAILQGMKSLPDDTPTTEVSVSALANELSRLRTLDTGERHRQTEITKAEMFEEDCQGQIERLEEQIRLIRVKKEDVQRKLIELRKTEAHDYTAEIDAVQSKIAGAEQINRNVRAHQSRKKAEEALAKVKELAAAKSDEIKAIAVARTDALRQAKFPVEGLSIGENGGVTLNNVPFDQASTAQQIMVGIAIGAAANSKLRVCLIRDASLLDASTMKMISEMAEKLDLQVWMERVEDNSPAAIQIVDGTNLTPEQLAAATKVEEKPKRHKKVSTQPVIEQEAAPQ